DVLIISAGFVIRAVSGAYIVEVEISPWLLICTFLLALLIAFGKRRNEILILGESADSHRKNLKDYSVQILDHYISITAACSIIAYSLYCISDRTEKAFHTNKLIYTIPFVIYGVLRYLYLLIFKKAGGEPELLLIKDKCLLIDVILWASTAILIIYNYSN
ncbi:decaprenyl-phosphate phosphoribosyltransferase, partial [Candidatus Dependentiae bacterium]|nr:decaprenyl-phosphate phosphoribosyltransferase [Candidatus Dependentiae bacterium]